MTQDESGFVMADALVALIIAALLMTGLIGVNQTASQATLAAEQKLLAAQLARSLLLSSESTSEGQQTLEGITFDWVLTQRRETPTSPLVQKSATVSWPGRSAHQSLTFKTATLEPLNAR